MRPARAWRLKVGLRGRGGRRCRSAAPARPGRRACGSAAGPRPRARSKRARMWVLTASTLRWSSSAIAWLVGGVAKVEPSLKGRQRATRTRRWPGETAAAAGISVATTVASGARPRRGAGRAPGCGRSAACRRRAGGGGRGRAPRRRRSRCGRGRRRAACTRRRRPRSGRAGRRPPRPTRSAGRRPRRVPPRARSCPPRRRRSAAAPAPSRRTRKGRPPRSASIWAFSSGGAGLRRIGAHGADPTSGRQAPIRCALTGGERVHPWGLWERRGDRGRICSHRAVTRTNRPKGDSDDSQHHRPEDRPPHRPRRRPGRPRLGCSPRPPASPRPRSSSAPSSTRACSPRTRCPACTCNGTAKPRVTACTMVLNEAYGRPDGGELAPQDRHDQEDPADCRRPRQLPADGRQAHQRHRVKAPSAAGRGSATAARSNRPKKKATTGSSPSTST